MKTPILLLQWGNSQPSQAGLTLIMISLFALGCADSIELSSTAALANGVRGKSWKDAKYIDLNPDAPIAVDIGGGGSNRFEITTTDYDLARVGSDFFVSGIFYDPLAAKMRGYINRFRPGGTTWGGWGKAGDGLQQVASPSSTLENTGIIGNPEGGALAVFTEDAAGGDGLGTLITVHYNGSWQTAETETPSVNDLPSFDTSSVYSDHLGRGNRIEGVIDPLGQTHLVMDLKGASVLYLWEQVTGLMSTTPTDLSFQLNSDGASTLLGTKTVYDGKDHVCTFSENASLYDQVRTVQSYCLVLSTSTSATPEYSPELGTEANISLPVGDTHGFDVASNGSGTLVAIFYQELSGKHYLMSNVAKNGVWSDSSSIVSSDLPNGYEAYSAEINAPESAPAIGYLGKDRFLAVWVGVDPDDLKARLFGAVYDAEEATWGDTESITSAVLYDTRPAFESITLDANGDENAVVGIRYIHTEGATIESDVRTTLVGRYHSTEGWLDLKEYGEGCSLPSANVLAFCTRRPEVAINADGHAVVVYQDQDTSGYYRIAAAVFDTNEVDEDPVSDE